MDDQAQALPATRTVAVRLPNGQSEYWLTDRVFSKGDTYTRDGKAWEVAEVLLAGREGHDYLIIRVKEGA